MHTHPRIYIKFCLRLWLSFGDTSYHKTYQHYFDILLNYKKIREIYCYKKKKKINEQVNLTVKKVIIAIKLRQQPAPLA